CSLQRAKDRHGVINTVGLNSHHLFAEIAPKPVVTRRLETGSPLALAAGPLDFRQQRGMPHELIAEILAMLEKIDRAPRDLRVRIEQCQPFRIGDHLFQERLEAVLAANDASIRDRMPERGRAQLEKPAHIDAGEFGPWWRIDSASGLLSLVRL